MTCQVLGGDAQARVWAGLLNEEADEMGNPPAPAWPYPEFVTDEDRAPMTGTLLPCGCHIRRPDYEAVLCDAHLTEMNDRTGSGDPS